MPDHEGTRDEHIGPHDSIDQWAMHVHRYDVAADYTTPHTTVLDAACGNGYGRTVLWGKWVGVDRVPGPGILQVDLLTWEPDFDFDVFVGIETIEHLPHLDHYVSIAKRAKQTIVISTPIIPTTQMNPYHLQDFTKESLEDLFRPWRVVFYEAQPDPILGPDIYGIWAFRR